MSPLPRNRARQILLVLLLAALGVLVVLDLLRPRSVVRGFFASPPSDVREPVVPAVDDAVREFQKGPPPRP